MATWFNSLASKHCGEEDRPALNSGESVAVMTELKTFSEILEALGNRNCA
jgi:hypothetical protein